MATETEELRRKIAERLGWKFETRPLSHSGDKLWRVLIRPSGELFETETGQLPRYDPLLGESADHALLRWCPDWTGDVSDALALALAHRPARNDLCITERFSSVCWEQWYLWDNPREKYWGHQAYTPGDMKSLALALSRLVYAVWEYGMEQAHGD